MKNFIRFILPSYLTLFSCNVDTPKDSIEQWKDEILETEQNFAKMAKEEGISSAFLAFAAEDAVLMRNNKLVKGKNKFVEYFRNQPTEYKQASLNWEPEFIDVAASGDLGYTYGKYTFSYVDSTGTKLNSTGVFHTVWKRQPNGDWRFVWD